MDTNIIINALKPGNQYLVQLIETTQETFACSDMVRLEVLGFSGIGEAEARAVQQFLREVVVHPMTPDVIDESIKIRQQKAIGSPDAIIAATTLIAKQKLWTTNVEDFSWIQNLKWHNPVKA